MIRLPETRACTGRQRQRRSPSPRPQVAHGETPFRLAQTRGIDARGAGHAPAWRSAHATEQPHPCEPVGPPGPWPTACARLPLWTRAVSLGCKLPIPSFTRFRAAHARRWPTCHQAATASTLPDRPKRRRERRVCGRRSPLLTAHRAERGPGHGCRRAFRRSLLPHTNLLPLGGEFSGPEDRKVATGVRGHSSSPTIWM